MTYTSDIHYTLCQTNISRIMICKCSILKTPQSYLQVFQHFSLPTASFGSNVHKSEIFPSPAARKICQESENTKAGQSRRTFGKRTSRQKMMRSQSIWFQGRDPTGLSAPTGRVSGFYLIALFMA